MQWMIANMWMALAAATFLGLLFGFSFRGLLSSNSVRRARVEREIAKTELTQAKAEVDALYAAQRKRKEEGAQAVGGDDTLRAELDERETRISALGEELAAAREELDQLRSAPKPDESNVTENLGSAAVGAVAGALLSDGDDKELTELRDRNAWLEDRVVALEADVSAAAVASPPAEAPAEPTPNVDKLNWQAAYLRQRVDALEAKLLSQGPSEEAPAPEPHEVAAPVLAAVPDSAPEDDDAKKAADEEMARLRWRNRYLEGRLAYFEENGDDEAQDDAEEAEPASALDAPSGPEAEAETVEEPAPETDAEASEDEVEDPAPAEPEPEETGAEEAAPEAASDPDESPEVEQLHPSDAVLAELEGEQPEQIEKPADGGDDLTAIAGIGPRIAEVLNSLGIWTYAQISTWKPANETWVENHLSFKGRVGREKWVEQASALMASA
jgi:predicted flap endonuclease-1-like 5' DNA nuclease